MACYAAKCAPPSRGQALVEFALVVPIILFLFLAMAEATFLFYDRHLTQRAADVLADVAAERMATQPGESWRSGWDALVDEEVAGLNCAQHRADVKLPDETHNPGDRVVVELRCEYTPLVTKGLWPGLTMQAQGVAVVRVP